MSERARAIRLAVNRFAFHRDQHHGWRRATAWLLVCNALTLAVFVGYIALHSTVYITGAATPDGRLVPPTPLGREYRDALGRVNQIVARRADRVCLMVAGLAMELKSLGAGPAEHLGP